VAIVGAICLSHSIIFPFSQVPFAAVAVELFQVQFAHRV
jgi:hypothetical protein